MSQKHSSIASDQSLPGCILINQVQKLAQSVSNGNFAREAALIAFGLASSAKTAEQEKSLVMSGYLLRILHWVYDGRRIRTKALRLEAAIYLMDRGYMLQNESLADIGARYGVSAQGFERTIVRFEREFPEWKRPSQR